MRRLFNSVTVCAFLIGSVASAVGGEVKIVSEAVFLGGEKREWAVFEGREAKGMELRVKFETQANAAEQMLFVRQEDVKEEWGVSLNGQRIGNLFLMEADLVHALTVPAGALKDGENELLIAGSKADDVVIHSVALVEDALPSMRALRISVAEAGGAGGMAKIPARITITDGNGSLAALSVANATNLTRLAARPGVVYTADGSARVMLRPGNYTVWVTRGPEYSMEKQEVVIEEKADGENEGALQFELRREVGTTNWVAADTHIHTLTLSKHGDALLQERMVTLAGEGVELAIATEHNLHASYSDAARDVGVEKFFTVVPGNEVTTKRGHFNVFPVSTGAPPADFNLVDWRQLIPAIRRSGGGRGGMEQPVVILNHPTDTHAGFTPFAKTNFNRLTGKNLAGKVEFDFEAMEVINSGAMRTDWMEPFECWFALLNRGLKVTGVAASDSHDVSRFIVGQGRTYIRGADTNVGALKVRELTENLREGRAVFGLGLFAQLSISDAPDALDRPSLTTGVVAAGASGPGDLHKGASRFFEVTASVDFPTWMNPEGPTVLTLYENGAVKVRFPFEMRKRAGRPLAFKARFPKLKGDAWYVLVAETPGVTNAYWSVARPYQPSGPEWHPQMIGATNPVYVDGDGNGFHTSPRKTAQVLCESYASPHDLIPALGDYGRGTALQVAEILHEAGIDLAANEFAPAFGRAAGLVKEAVRDYLGTVKR